MNRKVQSNYCSNNTKLNFTIEACLYKKQRPQQQVAPYN